MKISKLIVLVALMQLVLIWPLISSSLNADQSKERFENRLKEGMEQKNPIGENPLNDVTATDGFKYFSGNTCPVNNHPTIYAGAGRLFVVGYKYQKEFSIDNLSEAFKAYQDLLLLYGYLERDD